MKANGVNPQVNVTDLVTAYQQRASGVMKGIGLKVTKMVGAG